MNMKPLIQGTINSLYVCINIFFLRIILNLLYIMPKNISELFYSDKIWIIM